MVAPLALFWLGVFFVLYVKGKRKQRDAMDGARNQGKKKLGVTKEPQWCPESEGNGARGKQRTSMAPTRQGKYS